MNGTERIKFFFSSREDETKLLDQLEKWELVYIWFPFRSKQEDRVRQVKCETGTRWETPTRGFRLSYSESHGRGRDSENSGSDGSGDSMSDEELKQALFCS